MTGMENLLGAGNEWAPKALLIEAEASANLTSSILAMERSRTKKVRSRVTRSENVTIHAGAPPLQSHLGHFFSCGGACLSSSAMVTYPVYLKVDSLSLGAIKA